jgi:hypothetical protein
MHSVCSEVRKAAKRSMHDGVSHVLVATTQHSAWRAHACAWLRPSQASGTTDYKYTWCAEGMHLKDSTPRQHELCMTPLHTCVQA